MQTTSKWTLLLISLAILATLLVSGVAGGLAAQSVEPSPYPVCEEYPQPAGLVERLTTAYQCFYLPLMQRSAAP